MFHLWYFLVVVLTITKSGNCLKTIAPEDKEAVYIWKADVKAGTHVPTSYASQFTLRGKIHLSSRNESTFVKISDLRYRLYNGIIDDYHEHQTHEVPVPPQVQDLENVFKIVYNDYGLVEAIVTEDGEKEFSRNIKKAIATIFQINATVFEKEYHHPEGFIAQENSIHGHGVVDYVIFPKGGEFEVHKLHDMSNPKEMFSYFLTNTEHVTCMGKPEELVMHDSKKIYYIEKQNGYYVTKKILATGSVVYYPFEAKSVSQIIQIDQTFHLEEVVPLQMEYHINSEYLEKSLTYNPFEETEDNDNDNHLEEMLSDVARYLEEDHIKAEVPDTERGQLINRIQQLLLNYDTERFQQLQKTLPGDVLHIFHLILPLVRTDASTLFIKNLVVNKAVSDDVAVEMLQHMVENTRPWQHLLPKLEELIYLDETYSWEVRKSAILAFGSLIYESYIFSNGDEEPYKKYATEYISKLKSSPDYKTQFLYVLALRNMKLPMLIKELTPAFNGEWWQNDHLRYMSLWAVTPTIIQSGNPDIVIETIWPIITNQEEPLELRVLSIYIVLLVSPTESRLKNIISYLIEEPNGETYRIIYMLLQAQEKSKNICTRDLRIRLTQLMKFLPVPQRGTSIASVYGYTDAKYGFSAEIDYYFGKLNGSRAYVWYYMTQQYNMFQEDYILYLKIHDGKNDYAATPSDPLSDIKIVLNNFWNQPHVNKIHIEAALVKQGQIVNVYHFDETNLKDFSIVDLFKGESGTWTKNFIHMNYDRYHRGLIPTDLGIPALWEYLMPHVTQNNLLLSKRVSDKGLELELGYKYTNWIHYRHGLSFYNPISDVWQGINRYHSYDSALPIHLHATIDLKNGAFDFFWKGKNNSQESVIGLRTHVHQAVFIRGDYNRTIAKPFEVVTHKKKHKHEYPFINANDPLTNRKWYFGLFDSDVRYTYGDVQNQMYLFAQTDNKHFDSPLQWLLLTADNLIRAALYSAREGTYGFLLRGETDATDIDLFFRFDEKNDKKLFLGGTTWSSNITYFVKSQNQEVKSWFLNTTIDVKSGHQFASLKSELVHTVSGQADFRICVAGDKTWTTKGTTGVLNITGEDGAEIIISMKGEQSQEQLHGKYEYGSCQHVIPFSWPHYYPMACLVDHSTIRHYSYGIRTKNLPNQWDLTFGLLWDYIKSSYQSYSWYTRESTNTSGLKLEVEFPLENRKVEVTITTPEYKYELSGVPTKNIESFGVVPESLVYPRLFLELYKNENLDYCTIFHDHSLFNQDFVSDEVPQNWTLYTGNGEEAIYAKNIGANKIAIKVTSGKHSLVIIPTESGYKITQNGEDVSSKRQNHEDWIYYKVISEDIGRTVVGFLPISLIHFEHDGKHVVIVNPKNSDLWGHCYSHRHTIVDKLSIVNTGI